ncbi:MAG: hypothetical protein EXS41_00805 [Opitutaceae bacterium]|nr:hypothetical protein [Opitutaceae bacterium]
MTLNPEQKQAVASWVAAGDNLSAVQKKLAEQFKISMTYMDVRFLVDDLGLELKNAAPKANAADVAKTPVNGGGVPSGLPSRVDGGPPRPPAPGKKGFLDKLKEKVGVGQADETANLPADDLPEPAGDDLPVPPAGPGGVTLELDRIVRPGSMVSGTVTFSDGVTGKWALDQHGRLMLETPQKGYQPSPADVQAFQRELQAQLQRQGF